MLDLAGQLELPEIVDGSLTSIRRQGMLTKRLPMMPTGESDGMFLTKARQIEAEKFANDVRASYAISRQQKKHSEAKARARNRQAQKQAERR